MLMTVLLAAGQAGASAATELKPEVGRLVRQLNSDELTRRDQAEQQLIALGPAAATHLPPIGESMPAEVAQRLTRVRQALERARAQQAAEGSTVTLKGDVPLGEVLKEFRGQTGNTFTDRRDRDEDAADATLPVDFEKTLFWRALDQVLDEAGLDIDSYAGEAGIALVGRAPGRTGGAIGACYSGPFRLEPARFEALRDLRNPETRSLKLFVDVAWEPRLKPIVISQPLGPDQGHVGDAGDSHRRAGRTDRADRRWRHRRGVDDPAVSAAPSAGKDHDPQGQVPCADPR